MTLTLELPPHVEERLRTNAALHDKDIAEYVVALVENDTPIDLTEFRDMADFEKSVAELREGFADLEAGRTLSSEDVIAGGRAETEEWHRRREAAPQAECQPGSGL